MEALTNQGLRVTVQARAYRKGAIDNEEEAKDEEASTATTVLLQLCQAIANGCLVAVVQARVCNQAEKQHPHKQKHPCSAYEAYVTCSTERNS